MASVTSLMPKSALPYTALNRARYSGRGVQGLHRQLVGEGHLQRVLDGARRLRLQILARPSQNCTKLRLELSTVGELIGPSFHLWPRELTWLSTPPVARLWQELQEMALDFEPRLEEQHLAQLDFFRCAHLGRFHRLDRLVRPPHPWRAQRQQQTIFIHFFSPLVAVHNSSLSLPGKSVHYLFKIK